MDQNKPMAVLKDPLLKEFGSYSSRVETSYEQWPDRKQDIAIWKDICTTGDTWGIFVPDHFALFSILPHL